MGIGEWLKSRLRRSRRQSREVDLERELRTHVDLEAEEQAEAGLPAEEARCAARRALGNSTQIKEDVRSAWGFQWFETLLQDLRYRGFTKADDENTAPVAIVNQAFVKRFFKSTEDPLNQHFGLDLPENAGTFRIVGVVRDAKFAGFALSRPARPMFYVPLAQWVHYKLEIMQELEQQSHFIGGLMLVTNTPPGVLEPLLRRSLAELDPNLTVMSVRTMQQQVDLSFDQQPAVASLAGLFGIVALILAGIGLYGVTAYTVAQRTNEIGIRVALGADGLNVVRLVLRGAFNRVALGLLIGLPLSVGAGRLIAAQLYGVSSWDPLALIVAASALAVCAFCAAIIPAVRVAKVDPIAALRHE
jgi:hypothetical protein